jgi:hypothetical protein
MDRKHIRSTKPNTPDIFMMLDDEETEDLVFLYLQSKGWYVVPHSRKGDSMTFEYLCVNPLNGKIAGTQVKTGNTPLNRDDYYRFREKVFLFQPNDLYLGIGTDNVRGHSTNRAHRISEQVDTLAPEVSQTKDGDSEYDSTAQQDAPPDARIDGTRR